MVFGVKIVGLDCRLESSVLPGELEVSSLWQHISRDGNDAEISMASAAE